MELSKIGSFEELQEQFAHFFLDRNTSHFFQDLSNQEVNILKKALGSVFEMKCLLEIE